MKNLYKIMLVVFFGATILYAGDGLSQPYLVSATPSPNDDNIPQNTTLSFIFDSPIIEKFVKSHSITLKQIEPIEQKIKGDVSILAVNTLVFTPLQPLTIGSYKVKVKPVKLQKENKDTIETHPIHYAFEVKENTSKIISLKSNTSLVALSEHNSTQLTITATYNDNSSENITQKASYTSSDSSVADIDKGLVSTFKEGSTMLEVSYGGKVITITVEVYELIEGHLLPHEPENPDETLLGVDENDNGVRDEVERWIYKNMPTYHHPEIERVIAMQDAEAYQMALVDPTNQGDHVVNAIHRASNCWWYYQSLKSLPMDGAVQKFNAKLTDKSFNTKERLKAYFDYDYSLKGRVFTSSIESINDCDTNINLMQ